MQKASKIRLEELIAHVARSDRKAFSEVYEMTSAQLHAICLSILKDRPEAEDALEDTYVRLWQDAAGFPLSGLTPMTWLITITRNCAIDRLRKRRSLAPVLSVKASAPPSVVAAGQKAKVLHRPEGTALRKCLAQLDDDQASAVLAVYLEGVSYNDLARRDNKPVSAVRDWLRRSLLHLKECASQ